MTVQITIIGLGQIGASIGLALKARNLDVRLVGHDKDPQAEQKAANNRKRIRVVGNSRICDDLVDDQDGANDEDNQGHRAQKYRAPLGDFPLDGRVRPK